MNLIFGSEHFGSIVKKSLETFSKIKVDGFMVDAAYANKNTFCELPVHLFEGQSLEGVNLFIGFTFEKRKGPNCLFDMVQRTSKKGAGYPGFNLSSNNVPIATSTGTQIFQCVHYDFFCAVSNFTVIRPFVSLGHNVEIAEYCYIAPGAKIGSNTRIKRGCFIGSNSSILPNSIINENCLIGSASIVEGEIPPSSLVKADPSKYLTVTNPYRFI